MVAQTVKNLSSVQETWVQSLGQESLLEEGMATYSNILAWRIPMDGGAWQAADHGVTKSQTLLSDKAEHSDFTPFFKTLQLPLPSRVPRTLRCCTAQFHPCIKTSAFALLSSWNAFLQTLYDSLHHTFSWFCLHTVFSEKVSDYTFENCKPCLDQALFILSTCFIFLYRIFII